MSNFSLLANLGWQPFFQQQLSLEEWDSCQPARVIEQHRSELSVATGHDTFNIPILASMPEIVVGDWILLNQDRHFKRLLDRLSVFKRKAAGTQVRNQLISSNIDTAFIVCSMNEDFNLNRLERYLSLVNEASVEPVLVLTKRDLCSSPQDYLDAVRSQSPSIEATGVNALNRSIVSELKAWLLPGKTICVLGSSGVGKSTLTNTLIGEVQQETQSIREGDAKGRHTTTRRSLISLSSGALIIDTPGMRELQLSDCKSGIETTFADIQDLASQCRFQDCTHQQEPGCAVRAAVEKSTIDQRRLDNYLKLVKEEALNLASLKERRDKDRSLGKFYKRTLKDSLKLKGR